MLKTISGKLILDRIDYICIGVITGTIGGKVFKIYRKRRQIYSGTIPDPIVRELKKNSPIITFTENGKPLKLPFVRAGDLILNSGEILKGFRLAVKNRRFAKLLHALLYMKTKQQQLQFLRITLFVMNNFLQSGVGLRFLASGSLQGVDIMMLIFPSTIASFIYAQINDNSFIPIGAALAVLLGREVKYVEDPTEKCRVLCRFAENYHNEQIIMEMKKLNNNKDMLPLLHDFKFVSCQEKKLSLVQRYKLKQMVQNKKIRQQVQHFSEFIKKFPECTPDPETVYEEAIKKVGEKIKI